MKTSIYNFTLEKLQEKFIELGLKKFNATQVFKWIYQKQCEDFTKITDISKQAQILLNDNFYFPSFKIISKLVDPKDETTKFLFELEDGNCIETVLMKFDYGYSVCISSQVGCNMGCKFCASGLLKKIRSLDVSEMVLQVSTVNKYLNVLNASRLSNLVVMGIGEPFDNYENLFSFLRIINDQQGICIGSRHITVSTCGIIPKILQFAKDFPQVNLAISLHAPNNEIRNKIMPINQAYDINSLIDTMHEYSKLVNRKITFEYLLLENVNDTKENALELAKLVKGLLCYVNLILYNSVSEHGFSRSERSEEFARTLIAKGINVTTRLERGSKINAACGQLRVQHEKKNSF